MEQKLYLEITYGDNDWAEAMRNLLPVIKNVLQDSRGAFIWSEDIGGKELNMFAGLVRKMIAAQLNLEYFFWEGDDNYDYTEDVANIKFDVVYQDNLKTSDNFETAYIQLFGSSKEYGNWFIV
jgi:hypothetical protein